MLLVLTCGRNRAAAVHLDRFGADASECWMGTRTQYFFAYRHGASALDHTKIVTCNTQTNCVQFGEQCGVSLAHLGLAVSRGSVLISPTVAGSPGPNRSTQARNKDKLQRINIHLISWIHESPRTVVKQGHATAS